MALRILQSAIDGTCGHITHLVRVEEETAPGKTSFGPEETIGIWPTALMSSYHDPATVPTDQSIQAAHSKWLAHNHSRMIERKHHLDSMARVVQATKGKLMEFDKAANSEVGS